MVARQAELDTQAAHFVLEQLAQRFDQAEFHVLGQATDIVMALDHMRLAGLAAGRLDHVRVDGALRQPLGIGELARFLIEDLDEQVADDLALGFRIVDALEPGKIAIRGVDANHFHAHVFANMAITWSPSCQRSRPVSTNTQVS
jgi:hypothetical protein